MESAILMFVFANVVVEKFGSSSLGSTSFAQPELVGILVPILVEYFIAFIHISKKP